MSNIEAFWFMVRNWLGRRILPNSVLEEYKRMIEDVEAEAEQANRETARTKRHYAEQERDYKALTARFRKDPEEPWHSARFHASKQTYELRIAELESQLEQLVDRLAKYDGKDPACA